MPQLHRRPSVDISSSSHVNQPALNRFIRVDEIPADRPTPKIAPTAIARSSMFASTYRLPL
jgi:hypothetical protein